jgi:hypothetical protein
MVGEGKALPARYPPGFSNFRSKTAAPERRCMSIADRLDV